MRFENISFLRYHFGFLTDLGIELWLSVLVGLLAFTLMRSALPRWMSSASHSLQSIGRHSAIALSAFVPLVARGVLFYWTGMPLPRIHDEWSNLFAAQTLMRGRLTNPTPAMWQHFETFHINMVPTYQSMYLPGHAMMLALGRLLFGQFWFGAWIEVTLLAAATCWMLQSLLPNRWALLGGILCGLRFGTYSYWINCYHGGALTAAGGALFLGAFIRLRGRFEWRNGLIFAAGLVMMGFTRPYEGALFALPCLIAATMMLWRDRAALRAAVPGVLLVIVALAWLGYYNYRGTGSATKLAYVTNEEQYHITRPFIFESLPPEPAFRHASMRTYALQQEAAQYDAAQSWHGRWLLFLQKLTAVHIFYLFPLTPVVLGGFVLALKDDRWRVLAWSIVTLCIGAQFELWMPQSHYYAPMTAAVFAILLLALFKLTSWRPRGEAFGKMLAALSIGISLLNVALQSHTYVRFINSDTVSLGWNRERARIANVLDRAPGRHLVIVRYGVGHVLHQDWIYNSPDIESSKTIWARDMGDDANEELFRYYSDRDIYMIYPEREGMPLTLVTRAAAVPNKAPLRTVALH